MSDKIPNKAKEIGGCIWVPVTSVLAIILFIICKSHGFHFFTGVDYSGHGFWSWLSLFLTCSFLTMVISILGLWPLGLTNRHKPIWWMLIFGVLFFALCACGVPKRLHHPILFELLFGAISAYSVYFSLMINSKK